MQDDSRATLRRLVAEFLERRDAIGEAAALAEACAAHPNLSDAIRKRVASLRRLGMLGQPAAAPPQQLGEFRLLRRIGGGGMGVVYEAEQESLQRRVALKVLREVHDQSEERFRREAEAAARLQHPGIVAVYGHGRADGVSYIAMELVDGQSLAEWIQERRAQAAPCTAEWERDSLRLVRDAAEALEHAHRRGVTHRDIKPSNLMRSRAGRLLILDFGLAGVADAQQLTRSGAQFGSLPYMAPEQLRGDARTIGPATDVYALGVTLYELLSLRSPFLGETSEITRTRILEGRPLPLRRCQPALSWEAETVCAKAMDPDSSRRYASAADFARDLGNVLERRPIAARRPHFVRRAQRWVQRNPARAAATALAVLVGAGGPLGFAWQQRLARQRVQEQFERAEREYATAVEAVERLTKAAQEDLSHDPRLDPVRRRLLEDALEFHLSFLERAGGGAQASAEAAAAHLRAGHVQSALGDVAAARQSYQEAIALFERLPERPPWADGRLAAAHASLATHLTDTAAAHEHYGRSIALLAGSSGDAESTVQLAKTHSAHASLWLNHGGIQEGSAELQRARDLLLGLPPGHLEARPVLAEVYVSLANLALATQGGNGTEEACRACIELFEADGAAPPAPVDRLYHGLAYAKLADAARLAARWSEAQEHYQSAVRVLEDAAARLPFFPRARQELGDAYRLLGGAYLSAGNDEDAEAPLDRAVAVQDQLVREYPDNPKLRRTLGQAHAERARALAARGRWAGAESGYAAAAEILKRLVDENPGDHETRFYLARVWRSLGNARNALGRRAEAGAALHDSHAALEALVAELPQATFLAAELANTLVSLGAWHALHDRLLEARAAYERAADTLDSLPRPIATRADYAAVRDHLDAALGSVLVASGELETARPLIGRALAAQEARAAETPESDSRRQLLAEALLAAAELALADGRTASALEQARRARELSTSAEPNALRLARLFSTAGIHQEALELLGAGLLGGELLAADLDHPAFAPLRPLPGFAALRTEFAPGAAAP